MGEFAGCPQCGVELPAGALADGLCPGCLLASALARPDVPARGGPDFPAPGERFGAYRILRLLGEGGMGVVYLAEQEEPIRRQVAIKVIKLGMDTHQVIARFESERQALALMEHPNIARVYEAGATRHGRPYFVMEYVPGTPFTEFCDQNRINNRRRLELFVRVCHAVQHAHQKGIIHRDLKPSNVLVTIQDGLPVPKIIDFGLARAIRNEVLEETAFTQAGVVLGTPEYMSPEQAESRLDIDTRTDIYSLGVLLYELLVGAVPFDARSMREAGLEEMRRVIREKEPPSPTLRLRSLAASAAEVARKRDTDPGTLEKQLRGDLEWITLKALEKDRGRRYASASELAADLERHFRDEPVLAGPAGAWYRAGKFLRKNRVQAGAAAAVLLSLLAGLIATSSLYVRAERQRELAARRSYAANLAAADAHIEDGEVFEARRRLNLCEPGLRGWEWRHLYFRSDSSIATLYARPTVPGWPFSSSSAFTFAPSRILWSNGTALTAWEASTLKPAAVYSGMGRILATSADGRRLVATARPRAGEYAEAALRIFDPVSGRLVAALEGHRSPPMAAAFSLDGSRVATGARDGELRIWDARSGRVVAQADGSFFRIMAIAYSPDGQRIASSGDQGSVQLWDAASARTIATLRGHAGHVLSLAFSPDGKRIASAGDDRTIRIWESSSATSASMLVGHADRVLALAFSPDGSLLASGSMDNTVRLWAPASGRLLAVLPASEFGAASFINSVAFTPDGSRILAGCALGEVRLWDRRTLGGTTLKQASEARALAFDPDGQRIVAASGTAAQLWDAKDGRILSEWSAPQPRAISAAFSPDGKRVATGGIAIRVWDIEKRAFVSTLRGHQDEVRSIAFAPNGQLLASGSRDKTVRVWDLASGNARAVIDLNAPVNSVAFSPDGTAILTGAGESGRLPSDQRTVRLWSAATGKSVVELEPPPPRPQPAAASAVAFSPDGRRVAAVGASWVVVCVWDVRSGKLLAAMDGHDPAPLTAVAFSPDGRRLLSAGWDKTVRIWDALAYEPLLRLSHPGAVLWAGFDPGGRRVLSLANDGTVRVWDTPPRQEPEAKALVASLRKKLYIAERMRQAVEADRSLDPGLRRAALALIETAGDRPDDLNRASWAVAKSPGGTPEAYGQALRQAEAAARQAPDEPAILNTLAAAQYRAGRYEDCLASLTRSESERGQAVAEDLALRAMAYHRLGRTAEALATMHKLREFVQQPDSGLDQDGRDLLREAEALMAAGK